MPQLRRGRTLRTARRGRPSTMMTTVSNTVRIRFEARHLPGRMIAEASARRGGVGRVDSEHPKHVTGNRLTALVCRFLDADHPPSVASDADARWPVEPVAVDRRRPRWRRAPQREWNDLAGQPAGLLSVSDRHRLERPGECGDRREASMCRRTSGRLPRADAAFKTIGLDPPAVHP